MFRFLTLHAAGYLEISFPVPASTAEEVDAI